MDNDFDEIMNYDAPKNKEVFEKLSALCSGDRLIVPYIGAGLSVFAGFPLWKNCLVKFINEYCNDKTISIENLYDAADAIIDDLKSEKFNEVFVDTFGGRNWNIILEKAKNEAVSVIPELFNGPIITTNFDQILEKIHNLKLPIAFPNNIEEIKKAIKNRKRLIYKIHGCVSKPSDVVFTGQSYIKEYSDNPVLVQILSDFFRGFRFIFLGCGLDLSESGKDKPIELWEELGKRMVMKHYAILACEKDKFEERRKELENRNIYPIFYNSGKDNKEHVSVKKILDKLLSEKNAYSTSEKTLLIAKELLAAENKSMVDFVIDDSTSDMKAIEKDKEKLTREAKKIFGNISKNASLKYNKNRR